MTPDPEGLPGAKRGLWALAAWYTAMLGLSLALDAQVPGGPPRWVSAVVLAAMSASNAGCALALGPRRAGVWGWAVMSAGFSALGCVPAPLAFWVVARLFSPQVRSWCLQGAQAPAR